MSRLLGGPCSNECWEQARTARASKRETKRDREGEVMRKKKSQPFSYSPIYARELCCLLLLVLLLLRRVGRLSRSLARSLAPTGISPTTFRRRGCTPRFGEDLVINHDAAISQSNVRSLVGARKGKEGYDAYTVVCEERRRAAAEEEDDEKKGGRVAIS